MYHGLASKHPLVPKLARQIRMDERSGNSAGGVVRELGDTGGRRGSGSGRRESDDARANVDKGRRSSKVLFYSGDDIPTLLTSVAILNVSRVVIPLLR